MEKAVQSLRPGALSVELLGDEEEPAEKAKKEQSQGKRKPRGQCPQCQAKNISRRE